MLYFELCECPKCKKRGTFLPSFELTLNDFLDTYDQGALLVLNEVDPPKSPEYIIFSCEEPCGFTKKMTDLESLEFAREAWAKVAWTEWQRSVRAASEFDKNFTRFILDGELGKFVTQKDLDEHPYLKDYIKAIEGNDKAKHTKIRKD